MTREQRLEKWLAAIADTFERAVRHHETKGQGGMQVPFHDDFANVPPSAVGRMRWWAREFRAALAEPTETPRPLNEAGCYRCRARARACGVSDCACCASERRMCVECRSAPLPEQRAPEPECPCRPGAIKFGCRIHNPQTVMSADKAPAPEMCPECAHPSKFCDCAAPESERT